MTLLKQVMIEYAKVLRHYGIGSKELKKMFEEGRGVQGFAEIAELMHGSHQVVAMVLGWENQSPGSQVLVMRTDDEALRKYAEMQKEFSALLVGRRKKQAQLEALNDVPARY